MFLMHTLVAAYQIYRVPRLFHVLMSQANSGGTTGWTALLIASYNGHFEVVELLIAAGADIGALDPSVSTGNSGSRVLR